MILAMIMATLLAAPISPPGPRDAFPESTVKAVTSLYIFTGNEGAIALTIDPNGKNLPLEYGPWVSMGSIRSDHQTFSGADKAALDEVTKRGFSIQFIRVTHDPVTTVPQSK